MKKQILALAIMSLISTALADNSFYVKSGIGINWMAPIRSENDFFKNDTNMTRNNPVYELAIGYLTKDDIRLELAFDYHFLYFIKEKHSENSIVDILDLEDDLNDSNQTYINTYKISTNTLMFNMYKNIKTFGKVTPFIGAGIGVGFRKSSLSSKEQNYRLQNKKFVYKLTCGMDFKINYSVTMDLSYNYFDLNKNLTGKYHKNKSMQVHNITIGTRISL